MAERRWTLLIVPEGVESARSISVSERALRRLAPVAGTIALLCLISGGSAISQVGSASAKRAYAANRPLLRSA